MNIPDDVMLAARQCAVMMTHPSDKGCARAIDLIARALLSERESATKAERERCDCKFPIGSLVTKTKGSSWTGHVVGFYSTSLTPIGYAVESINEPGSVQIYPESALAAAIRKGDGE